MPARSQQRSQHLPTRNDNSAGSGAGRGADTQVKVTVRLPRCIVECLVEAYGEAPYGALRRFILDVFRGTLERVTFPDRCLDCARHA